MLLLLLAGQLEVLQVEPIGAAGGGGGGRAGLAGHRVPTIEHQLSVIKIDVKLERCVVS